MKAMIID